LNIPDDSFWSVLLHINVTDIAGATTYNGLHMVTLQKYGGAAVATGVILINEDNGFATVNFAINIDTTTNTDEHRIEIVTTGTGYTYIFFTTVTLTYTAVR
jgi:spermidine synthase